MLIHISLPDAQRDFPAGVTVKEVLTALLPAEQSKRSLCALCEGRCLELNHPLERNCALQPLTYADEEGRRVYERSLRFLFLLSLKRLYPAEDARVLNSVGHGLYIRLIGREMSREMVSAIEHDMRELVRQDLPFEKENWTNEQAAEYFASMGWTDKSELMAYRHRQGISMYHIGPLYEYFYGSMLPSTGYLKTFSLKPHFPGVVVMLPDPENPDQPAVYYPRTKFLRQFTVSQEWCRILGTENAADVNRMIKEGRFREFIRVNEALHDRSIASIASDIVRRQSRIVMVFGPSSSGKTTFANRLAVHLRALGKTAHLLSLDDFYRNKAGLPLESDGKPDLESINALDIPYLSECLEKLLSGKKVQMPRYSFHTGCREPEGVPLTLASDELLIVEGIHGMNEQITGELPEQLMFGVYVSALACINLDDHNRIRTTDVRLLRRIVRDSLTRNTTPLETIDMWPSVRAGEEKWIFPNQEKADVMFNTSLHYELPVLKTLAYDAIRSIPLDAPQALVAHRLLKTLNYFLPADANIISEIPPLSILREFLGNCSFYDNH